MDGVYAELATVKAPMVVSYVQFMCSFLIRVCIKYVHINVCVGISMKSNRAGGSRAGGTFQTVPTSLVGDHQLLVCGSPVSGPALVAHQPPLWTVSLVHPPSLLFLCLLSGASSR